MRTIGLTVILLISFAAAASGQLFYWGVIGGTNLTADIPRFAESEPGDAFGNPAYQFERLPGSRRFIVGGLLEVNFNSSLAIEADILHRPLPDILVFTEFPAGAPSVTTTQNGVAANTWEFPVMFKWTLPSRLAGGRVRPFLEGGPAFRTSQDDSSVLPSQFGLTAGAGVAIHFGRLRVAPTIRYTRWDKETHFPPYPTRADQIEFLTSVAWETSKEPLHPAGRGLSLGILAGLSAIGEFYNPDGGVKERIGDLAGLSGQMQLRQGLALEVDAIYKPLHDGPGGQGFTVLTWDIPVLAKYHPAKLGPALFVEAGPSFRATGNLNGYNPSHFGMTAGVGAERRKHGARLSAALRYTRWVKDGLTDAFGGFDYPRTNVNALELILGIGF